ncbi:MAG: RNA methyltransferase, partial [Clostridia bacterium]|nr:RNA methyltransferase [Clostridia bacterium]
IRSAAAFGADTVLCSGDCADLYNPKTVRSAMGNLFRMKVVNVGSPEEAVSALRRLGRRVFTAELTENAVSLFDLKLRESDVFVIGNEGHGIPPSVSRLCDKSVYIPIKPDVESLNASVAAAVLLYEQFGKIR